MALIRSVSSRTNTKFKVTVKGYLERKSYKHKTNRDIGKKNNQKPKLNKISRVSA